MSNKYTIRSVERALQVLLCFTADSQTLTIDQITERVGLHKSTVYRILATLEANGFLEREAQDETYQLGPAVLLLGTRALGQLDLLAKARPHLKELMEVTGETVHLAVLNQDQGLVIDKIDSFRSVRMASTIGFRSPLHCTGVGKALLAYQPPEEIDRLLATNELHPFTEQTITDPAALKAELAQIRAQGIARDWEEKEPGLRCVAAPIWDYSGKVVASVSVSGPSGRLTEEEMARLGDTVSAYAQRISRELGHRTAPASERQLQGSMVESSD